MVVAEVPDMASRVPGWSSGRVGSQCCLLVLFGTITVSMAHHPRVAWPFFRCGRGFSTAISACEQAAAEVCGEGWERADFLVNEVGTFGSTTRVTPPPKR